MTSGPAPPFSSGVKRVAVNALLVVGGALVALAGAEVVLGLSGVQSRAGRKVLFQGPSGFGHCYSTDPERYWPISLGERPRDLQILQGMVPESELSTLKAQTPHCILYELSRKQRGSFASRASQVLLVGDSFCFGEGLREEDTLGSQLGLRYDECNFRNLGWPGTDVDEVAASVADSLREKPDLRSIVYFYNLNDIPDAFNPMTGGTINDLENIRWAGEPTAGNSLLLLLRKTRTIRLALETLVLRRVTARTIEQYNGMYLEGERRAGFVRVLQRFREMRDRAAGADVAFTVVIYPLLYKDIFGRYPFQRIHDLIVEECRGLGIDCVDAAAAFGGYRDWAQFTLHEIDLHPNGRANRLVADFLAQSDRLGLRAEPVRHRRQEQPGLGQARQQRH